MNSLPGFAQFPAFLTISGFLAGLAALKLLACLAMTSIILAISQKIRHPVYTLLICILTLVLPILLSGLGLTWCGYLSWIVLFNAGDPLAVQNSGIVAAYTFTALVTIVVTDGYVIKGR